jgi:CheY-like chemotaxis protein
VKVRLIHVARFLHGWLLRFAAVGPAASTFGFVARARATTVSALPDAEPHLSRSEKSKDLRVLLVDDDPLVSMGTADMLFDLGHSVTEARSGAQALDLLGDSPFDIVITDYAMPCMNGFALAQRIRERRPDLPIILATGYAELPADRSIQFGLLSKPYTSRDLTVALEKAVALGW